MRVRGPDPHRARTAPARAYPTPSCGMAARVRAWLVVASLCFAGPTLAQSPTATTPIDWNTTARLLAGMKVDGDGRTGALAARASLREHQGAMNEVWQAFANRRLAPMRRFAQTELSPLPAAKGPVYYPFSGPDALHALALFPDAREFLLTGLEPSGRLPDLEPMDEPTLRASLALLRRSISSVLSWSFFRTNDMKVDLRRNRLEGVAPILLAFTARYGFEVTALEPFVLGSGSPVGAAPVTGQAAGTGMAASSTGSGMTPTEAAHAVPSPLAGLRLRFRLPGETAERSIAYVPTDLSNAGLDARPEYIQWVKAARPAATMLKSASYLLHRGSFSRVRGLILEQTALVVQDDSGIPWQHFATDRWTPHLYGHYTHPIKLFANRAQADLRSAYAKASPSPLPFAYGYNFQDGGNNLQRFTRQDR